MRAVEPFGASKTLARTTGTGQQGKVVSLPSPTRSVHRLCHTEEPLSEFDSRFVATNGHGGQLHRRNGRSQHPAQHQLTGTLQRRRQAQQKDTTQHGFLSCHTRLCPWVRERRQQRPQSDRCPTAQKGRGKSGQSQVSTLNSFGESLTKNKRRLRYIRYLSALR